MASAEADTCALSCVGRQDRTLAVKHKQEEALVAVEHLQLSRGPCLLGCPAGYGKSSSYKLLAFMYDFKLKWTRSRGTERNVVYDIVLLLVLTK